MLIEKIKEDLQKAIEDGDQILVGILSPIVAAEAKFSGTPETIDSAIANLIEGEIQKEEEKLVSIKNSPTEQLEKAEFESSVKIYYLSPYIMKMPDIQFIYDSMVAVNLTGIAKSKQQEAILKALKPLIDTDILKSKFMGAFIECYLEENQGGYTQCH